MRKRVILAALAVLALAAPAGAHHSGAMFDNTKMVKFEGVVKTWQWTNPHSFLTLKTKRGDEKFETGSPNTMFRNGWRNSSFAPGEKVSLYAYPYRDGRPGGMIVTAKTAKGEALQWLPAAATASAKIID